MENMQQHQVIRKGEGQNYPYSQDHCYIKVHSKDTNGELCVGEDTVKPGFFLKRHHHKVMTEVFYILEGEMELRFDDETVVGRPGDTITVPPNVWHEAYCEAGGRMITIFKNGRFDDFLERISHMTSDDFADKEKMVALNHEFDIYHS